MKKLTVPFNRAAQVLLGLAVMVGGVVQAQNELPLSGPAFALADQAYKSYAQGDYRSAAESAREAVRLRPDVASLKVLLRRAEAAQVSPPRVVGGGAWGGAYQAGCCVARFRSCAFVARIRVS